jgi:hypothetical protein
VSVASTNAGESKKRNATKIRHARRALEFGGLAHNVGGRFMRAVQDRPILALSGALALGFVTGAAVARRDGHLFVGAARVVLGWVAANLDA